MYNINNNPVKLLQNLIRFDTSNPPGNESECIKYINELLINAGFETQILSKDTNRLNLITRLKGQGSTNPLLLYGHVPNLFEGVKYAIGEVGGFTFYIGKKKFYPIMITEKSLCYIKITVTGPSGHGSLSVKGGASEKLGNLLTSEALSEIP